MGNNNERDELIKQLIEEYELIINGDDESLGLFSCYDVYYQGSWDDNLKKIDKLKAKINIINNHNSDNHLTKKEWIVK